MSYFLGVDPGSSGGGIAFLDTSGDDIVTFQMKDLTPHDFAEHVREYQPTIAWVEKVHAMPKQGVSSMFKFGENFGGLQWSLAALGIRYGLILPSRWMRALNIPPRKKETTKTAWKNVLKAEAQRRYPGRKVTLNIADAMLIATACRLQSVITYER